MADFRPLEQELYRYLEQQGFVLANVDGDKVLAIGDVIKSEAPLKFSAGPQAPRLLSLTDLAEHLVNVHDGFARKDGV